MEDSDLPRNGPDQILPANDFRTHDPRTPVILALEDYGPAALKPMSAHTALKEAATNFPNHPALVIKRDDKWKCWSYSQYYTDARKAAKAFIKLGLDRFHGVCIMGAASPEWVISYMGCIFAGGLSVGVYTTNSPESCRHVAEQCKAQVIVVQDEVMLEKFLAVKHNLPHLKVIIQWLGIPGAPGVLSWPEFLAIGGAERDVELNDRLALSAINQCCTLIFTSGTTGPPKGVMLSQDNLNWSARFKIVNYNKAQDVWIFYLPPNHIASIIFVYYAIHVVSTSYFAPPDALQGSLLPALQEVQPTGFFGVPRIWEKMYEGITMISRSSSGLTVKALDWARDQGFNYWSAQLTGRKLSSLELLKYNTAEKYILKKVKEKLGLSRAIRVGTGSAPTDKKIFDFFMSFGLCLTDSYGMSESTGLCSATAIEPGKHRLGTVGKIHDGIHVKLIDGNFDLPGGEICMKGRNVCMGYINLPEQTKETIDDKGWLHSGDLGKFDKDGFLTITGRMKEILITAGGENVPPVRIEEKIKKELPFISNAMLVGDKRKCLCLLLTLKTDMDITTGAPLPTLIQSCKAQLESLGSAASTVDEVINELKQNPHHQISVRINEGIEVYNEQGAESHAQKIQNWRLLPHDFSLPTGELNNTLKLKRSFVLQKYSSLIQGMYDDLFNVPSKL